MSTRSILVSYAGYPYTASSLMPDNGLANLAGCLINEGHTTLVLDYGTTDLIKRLYPPEISKKFLSKLLSIFQRMKQGVSLSPEEIRPLFDLERELEVVQRRESLKIASEISRQIDKLKPDFLGFKLWNGDGFSGSIRIAEHVKKSHPGIKIFAGGPHVDIFREKIYTGSEVFDAIVYGEGESSIIGLAEYSMGKKKLEDISNLIFKKNGRFIVTKSERIQDLNRLPFPVYDESIYPSMKGNQKIKIVVLDESRGCPSGCYFCIQPIKSGEKVRVKDAGRVVDEMEKITKKNGVRLFRYAGSATPGKLARSIAEEIVKRRLNVEYTAFGNVLTSRSQDFPALRKSGCYSIFFGIESGSRKILLNSFGKRCSPQRTEEVLVACKKAGIYTVGSVIFPAPFETEETKKETIDLLLRISPDSVPVQFSAIYPQTEWATNPERFNFSFTSPNWVERLMEYKIKLMFPPRFWESMPYTIDGKDFSQFSGETENLIDTLERNGILTAFSDEQALMAKYAGYKEKEKIFRDFMRMWFLSGDVEKIEEMVFSINERRAK